MKRNLIILFLLLFLIIVFSLVPFRSRKEVKRYQIDKIGHLFFYTLWTYFSYPLLGFFSFFYGIMIGLTMEYLQRYIPNREVSLGDLFFNLFGLFLGILFNWLKGL